jgi:mono/diheme cytochrome c family protein
MNPRRFVKTFVGAAVAAACSLGAAPGLAQDGEAGRRLAQQWCTGCHMIGPSGPGADRAPPFAAIANEARRTPAWLRAWLSDPHPPMVNPGLTTQEIQSIVAYILSLRRS